MGITVDRCGRAESDDDASWLQFRSLLSTLLGRPDMTVSPMGTLGESLDDFELFQVELRLLKSRGHSSPDALDLATATFADLCYWLAA